MTPKHKELSLVVHIPHAGTTIPASERLTYTNLPAVDAELNRLTDWFTDELFAIDGAAVVSTPINSPYDGCLVPTKYAGDQRVLAVMIEVNRALYLEQPEPALPPAKRADFVKVKKTLQRLVWELTSPR
jgi:N-formylglutamate amidohydrolase